MREILQEIMASIRHNRLRTFLTGFSVAWGIFMLIILLGSGNGLKNGVMSNFPNTTDNVVGVYSGRTKMPYGGYGKGRAIYIHPEMLERLPAQFPQITEITGRRYVSGQISYKGQFLSTNNRTAMPGAARIENIKMLDGRFFNDMDVKERRKVIVITENVAKVLFKNENPVGRHVNLGRSDYAVVGVCKADWSSDYSVYVPLTTAQTVYAWSRDLNNISFIVEGVESKAEFDVFLEKVRAYLAAEHGFDPTDKGALYLADSFESYREMMKIFGAISLFVWIIAIGTLTAGVVGVSNIMLVTVRERTWEFGVRKAIGATSGSIVRLVIVESLLITAFFGYIGMILGVGVMELVNLIITRGAEAAVSASTETPTIFLNPTLELPVTVSATLVLVIAGLVAGYVPARRASKINIIDALRYNK